MNIWEIKRAQGGLKPREAVPPAPTLAVPPSGVGVLGCEVMAVQVTVKLRHGAVTGGATISQGEIVKGTGFEITRMCNLDDLDDVKMAWLNTRLGRREDDQVLRPQGRHRLVMWRSVAGMPRDMVGDWQQLFDQLGGHPYRLPRKREAQVGALGWAKKAALLEPEEHFGLILVVGINGFRQVVPRNDRYEPYQEAAVVALYAAEAVKLAKHSPVDPPLITAAELADDEDSDVLGRFEE